MFRIAINKLFEWLFSRVLASHRIRFVPETCQFWNLKFRMEMTLIKSLYNLLFTGGFCLFTYGTVYVPYILVPVKNMSCCFQSMIEEPEKVDWVQGEIPPIGK